MRHKNELDDFLRRKLEQRQPAFSPQAWHEAQELLGQKERQRKPQILWAWWLVVATAGLLAAYIFVPGASQPQRQPVQVQPLVQKQSFQPTQPYRQKSIQLRPEALASASSTKTTATKATQSAHFNPSTRAEKNRPANRRTAVANQQAKPEARAASRVAAATLLAAPLSADKGLSATAEPAALLANNALAGLSLAAADKINEQPKLLKKPALPKASAFSFSLIGGLSVGQVNNAKGLQRNSFSPLLGGQLDFTFWRKRGLRLGIGLAALVQSYHNMQHQSLINRSLQYDFGYSTTTQWIDLQHLSTLSTPLLLHFQAGPHRISAGPTVLWRLSYAQSVNEQKESNFGLVSRSSAIMDQSLEQSGFLAARSINEQSLQSYAPRLQHIALNLRYELQFLPRWSIGAATTLGATDWVQNNLGQDFWMSGQGFLRFHF